MDQTLADYIKRLKQALEEQSEQDSPDRYPVYPEPQGEEDRPQNPYSPA